ncbi:MAG: guanylate kinase [Dehalococcoidales bacterium]
MKKASRKSNTSFNLPARPLLIILSGPSGAGKDAVLARMKESGDPIKHIITLSTRARRANEKNDVDYHFISEKRFNKMLNNNELLEWANVYDNWYGVPREAVTKALDRGQDVMIKVDIQGAATIKKILPQAITIFIIPPSIEELELRLKERRTESPSALSLRLKTAEEEMKQLPLFDYAVVNKRGEIDLAVTEIKAIITAEKRRAIPEEANP